MGLWTDRLLPRVVDRALRTPEVNARRARTLAGLSGRVLEIGFGSGLNLRHYPADVQQVLAVEPSDLAWQLAQPRIGKSTPPVERVGLDGARLPVPDASVDAVVSTFTLCTVPEVEAALAEIRRVLRPGSKLHFLEHGRAPEESVRRWQRRLQPLQSRVLGGCRLDRRIDDLVTAAGLEMVELTTEYGDGPKPFSYLYRGRAVAA
ncbi:MAG TPA: class I SAM-dependent methyltransferase [Propionibacteriaceae bacterium]|jgi:ubiquinone/menaquinone biosynthesis C-methylase UbiE|nr:class I SAM-dependent methyltransferase [Propionibacteriaceae bacterium]